MEEDTLIPFSIIERALMNRVGLNEQNAFDIAFRVMSYFGYSDEIIDNYLNPEDRRLFYFLQDMEILTTHWDESVLVTGRAWRIFYWNLNREKIMKAARPVIEVEEEMPDVYDTLPESLWERGVEAD